MSTSEIAVALAKAQAQFDPIHRDRKVRVSTRTGGTYEFSYAPLETILSAVRKGLADNGLALTQSVEVTECGHEYVITRLLHESGEIQNRVRVIVREEGPQAYGSALTYARRYGITLLLGLCADDDDDANAAEGNEVQEAANSDHILRPYDGSTPVGGGKYKGKPWRDVPLDYLEWACSGDPKVPKYIEKMAIQELQRRKKTLDVTPLPSDFDGADKIPYEARQ